MAPLLLALFLLVFSGAISSTAQSSNIFFENFETSEASDNWTPDQGTWFIGRPASGPRSAHEGTNCASLTITGGDYPINVNSRLIGPTLLVPDSSENPRLRFWHWFSIGGGDHATVEIKPLTSLTWRLLSPDYGDKGDVNLVRSGGAWTRPSLNLSAYAGQAIQIAFHFTSNAGSAPAPNPGWLVDEVTLVTGPYQFTNPEGFEEGLGDWSSDVGTWQVGPPTSGPKADHEVAGVNCASLALVNGDYPINIDSRLISPSMLVPPSGQNPRLRFWHWFSIGGGDHAVVEIKSINSTTWKILSPDYGDIGDFNLLRTSGGIWTRPSLDLSAYAGQSIQIAFHFISNPGSAPASNPGWLIDEISLVTGAYVSSNPDNFEGGPGDWYSDFGTWQGPFIGPGTAHEGTNCASLTLVAGNYPANVDSRLISPPFVVPILELNPRLRFWHWFGIGGGDHATVEIKALGSTSWAALSPDYGDVGNVNLVHSSGGWTRPSLDLSRYAGQPVQVAFHFFSDSGGNAVAPNPGWFIDEVQVFHEFAFRLLGSPIVRAQSSVCVPLELAASSPPSTISFVLQAPIGNLSNPVLTTEECWTGTLTPQVDSAWLVKLENTCGRVAMGSKTIGSICFTTISQPSAFVPFTFDTLAVTNSDNSQPSVVHFVGTRAVVIAGEPLLDSWLNTSQQRMVTVYGVPGKTYEIRYSSEIKSVNDFSIWTPLSNISIPATFSSSLPLGASLSTAPQLYLRAVEQ
jgi:hypothetical protein